MSKTVSGLKQEQVDRYWANGYLSGLPILTSDQMRIARKKLVELEKHEIEQDPQRWASDDYRPWTDTKSAWWAWFKPMATHPKILEAVRAILGPNILIRNADIFVKPANSRRAIDWHVDCTADPQGAGKMLTAWFAVTDSDPDNGCIEFLSGSHEMLLPDYVKDKTSLTFEGNALERANRSERTSNLLTAGQLSLHHFRTVHRSSGNVTDKPRIGLVIRFMAADTSKAAAESGKAFLACGENDPGHFMLGKTFPVSWQRSATGDMQSTPKNNK